MNNYLKKLPFNYFHYYAFSFLIVLLGAYNYLFFLLFIPYFYLIRYYKNKYVIVIISLIFTFYLFSFEKIFKVKPTTNTFKIVDKVKGNNNYTYYVKSSINKYVFFYDKELNIGDILLLDYNYEEFTKNQTPNGFNYKNYYASKRVFYKLTVKDIKVINNEFHYNQIKEYFIKEIDKYPKHAKDYLTLFLFNINNFSNDFNEAKLSLGIVHLFLISGIHLNFIINVLKKSFKKLGLNLNESIIYIILFIYLYLSGFTVSVLRVLITYMLFNLLKEKGLTRLDSLSISFILILLTNPFYRFRTGFILSFLISFILIISPSESDLKGRFIAHLKIVLSSVLIVSNMNAFIYPLSLFTGFLLTILFTTTILPIIFLSLITYLSFLTEPLLSGFTNLILSLEINYSFKVPHQSLVSIIIYLVIFIYCLLGKTNKDFLKRSLLLFCYIILIYFSPNYNFNSKIYFLDVNQGDATFIFNENNKGNILIDANKGTKSFLETLGEIEIDYFFITHGDADHASEAKIIIESFKVNNIVVSPYDNSAIINSLNSFNLEKPVINKTYNINGVKVLVLGPLKNYNNLNNNSLVLQLKFNGLIYLFTGDIEKEAVNDLIINYKHKLKSDVLHVSHHGANGGTPIEFLNYVRPKEAIISVGKNNYYNHPHLTTISNLEYYNVKIYLTSKQQTIIKRKYRFLFNN